MKKIFLIILLVGMLFPLVSMARSYIGVDKNGNSHTVTYEGLVPCGKEVSVGGIGKETIPCQFCHFFVILDGILDFLLTDIVPPLATLMFVVAGIMFFFAGADPGLMTKSKSIFYNTVLGLAIIYGGWIIINTVLTFLGVASWTGLQNGWFTISCPIYLPQ